MCFYEVVANGLRVGDFALCCACGKAILLTRC
jgi:RNA polymerase-binding transcription factor DksA